MKKLADLRRHLIKSPLGIDAKDVQAFAQKGRLTRNMGVNASFSIAYDGHVIVTDYAGNALDLFFVVLEWVDANLPALAPDAIRFHVDIVDHDRCDVSLLLPMSDITKAAAEEAGTRLTPQPDPDIRDPALTGRALGLGVPGE